MWGTIDWLLKSWQNPPCCGFASSYLQFRTLRFEQKNPKRQRGTFALGVGGSSLAEATRYELFEARQPTRSSAASVTQTPHSRQP